MYPILFTFGYIHIYSYGLMVALSFLVSALLLTRYAAAKGLHKDFFWNLCFWILIGGIIGGRLAYIVFNLAFFFRNPSEILMLWHGGLVWYGGFLGGLTLALWYIRFKKEPVFKVLDACMPFVALAHAIGRIGCFLNGCCYGKPAWWGIYSSAHNDYLIPSQLFASAALVGIFVSLRFFQEKGRKDGSVVIMYLIGASFERFFEEFLRNDSPRSYGGLTVFQVISAVLFLGAIILWCIISRLAKKNQAGA